MVESVPDWTPEGVDLTTPSAARMYDYYLGGAHNFGVDREAARKVLALYPDGQLIIQANRAFLHRAVRYLIAQGVRQFIDIGSGIPTVGNVHETAQREAPESRVLYVDHDSVAVAHSELILQDHPRARVLQADLRRPKDILNSPELRDLIDLSQPVGVLMVAVLHFITENENPEEAITSFREAIVPGSYLVVSHATSGDREDKAKEVAEVYEKTADPLTHRSHERVSELFQGWELVEPGVVWLPEWRPDWADEVGPNPASSSFIAAVGRKT
jgi:S-adenosyl methyltransferase